MTIPRRNWHSPLGCSRHLLTLSLLLLSLYPYQNATASASASPRDKRQEKPYALIFGTVWGPDDRPVYGVHIKVRRANEKKVRWELFSDHNGEFALRVPAGQSDYVFWADLKDFKSYDGRQLHAGNEVQVHVDYDERVDTGLHLK